MRKSRRQGVSRKAILRGIEEGVLSCTSEAFAESLRAARREGIPREAVLGALGRAMERMRAEFREGRRSVPEVLIGVDFFREAVRRLRPPARNGKGGRKGPGIVIGVVEGDVHDMGKNLVSGVLEAAGFAVVDAGRDVPRDAFLNALERTASPLLALSSMMSTALDSMKDVIQWTRRLYPNAGILVGGAALDARVARALGADGYAESAARVPEEAIRVLNPRKRSRSPRG
jgi:methanogenic corrinoid protein MtbC1